MNSKSSNNEFDVIVIGSGMGGMTTATALSRMRHKVLLLERAQTIGGLTHTFSGDGFSWDVGLHYCGMFGDDEPADKVLDWLSGETVQFQSIGTVYDTIHFPDGFEIAVGRPAEAYKSELKEHFPDNAAEIDAYFEALKSGEEAIRLVSAERSMPEPVRSAHRWWNKKKIDRWCGRTTDPKLAAVLSAQWGTYGGIPKQASFAIHALIIRHYLEGASYPVGGAGSIAAGLVPVIESEGSSARPETMVDEILINDGRAIGVRTISGQVFEAPAIVSAIGAGETVDRLLPLNIREQEWAVEIAAMKPSICHFEMFLGFEGDIEKLGATRSNHWFFESWDTNDGLWTNTEDAIQMMFVSFPSLKDANHDPGPSHRHTGQFMVLADWSTVADFVTDDGIEDPDKWAAFKDDVQTRMLAFFAKKFPALAPLVVCSVFGTPLATAKFTAHEKGGFYGLETTPRRIMSDALRPRTPVPGLYLTGQDVLTPGIAGSLFSGMLTAAAIDPRVYTKMR
jgi:all-trans-retinol 13,14-reductase